MTQEVTVKREGDTALLVDENGATFLELTPNQNDMLGLTWQTLRNLNHEKAAHDLLRVMDDIKTRPGVMPMVTTAAKERDGRPRCVHVERDNMGVRIITRTSWSPFPLPRIEGMPSPFILKTVCVCVPAGMRSFAFPESVGTSISAPSAACENVIGVSM